MASYRRAVPVLQAADVARSVRWYRDVLGFEADPFPKDHPHSFAILRREGAEIMLQCSDRGAGAHSAASPVDREFLWSVYLRISGTTVLDLAAAVKKKTEILRGPERMFSGLVELEIGDPDGHRVCLGGEAPAGAGVPVRKD